jgi:hypothetical protein
MVVFQYGRILPYCSLTSQQSWDVVHDLLQIWLSGSRRKVAPWWAAIMLTGGDRLTHRSLQVAVQIGDLEAL